MIIRILRTQEEVDEAQGAARRSYAARWRAFFGFPAPQELLDRWWPEVNAKNTEHTDVGKCCECGELTHSCQDCPVFT
jgi:hypothetical protein